MRLDCEAKIPDTQERKGVFEKLKTLANGYSEIGECVYATYCGADKRLAESIIAVIEQHQEHSIRMQM